eukprot:2329422-Pleurochrysis_carterae.AAC.1
MTPIQPPGTARSDQLFYTTPIWTTHALFGVYVQASLILYRALPRVTTIRAGGKKSLARERAQARGLCAPTGRLREGALTGSSSHREQEYPRA